MAAAAGRVPGRVGARRASRGVGKPSRALGLARAVPKGAPGAGAADPFAALDPADPELKLTAGDDRVVSFDEFEDVPSYFTAEQVARATEGEEEDEDGGGAGGASAAALARLSEDIRDNVLGAEAEKHAATDEAVSESKKALLAAARGDVLSAYSKEKGFREVAVHDLAKRLVGGVSGDAVEGAPTPMVIDVREPTETVASGVLPGARVVPLDRLSEAVRAGELDAFKDAPVVVVCQTGVRSAQATVRLSKVFGFADVSSLGGGVAEWLAEGLPTVTPGP